MTNSAARGLINILRSTLVLLGHYTGNKQIAESLLELKYTLVKTICELEQLEDTMVSAPPGLEGSTPRPPDREAAIRAGSLKRA